MIEPEICFCDLNGLMDIEEDFLKSVVREVLDKAMPELEFLQGYAKSNLIEKLQTLTQSHVARVTHAEAIDILQHATHPFEHPAVQGEDLFKEHEKYLTEEHFKSPTGRRRSRRSTCIRTTTARLCAASICWCRAPAS